jgi:hypothetical protein
MHVSVCLCVCVFICVYVSVSVCLCVYVRVYVCVTNIRGVYTMYIGKMMIYGAIFKCLDPILTIAASLSHRSPFINVMDRDKREEIDKLKKKLSADTPSDHLLLLKVYM